MKLPLFLISALLVACTSNSQETTDLDNIANHSKSTENKLSVDYKSSNSQETSNAKTPSNTLKVKVEEVQENGYNCIAIFERNDEIIDKIYLAGSLQENYFLNCPRHNNYEKINILDEDVYIFSVFQESSDNRSFPISRVVAMEDNKPVDKMYESNLLNNCFLRSPVQDISIIKELLLYKNSLDKTCNQEHGEWKFTHPVNLYNEDFTKSTSKILKNDIGYVVNSKKVDGKTWYQIDISDRAIQPNKWIQCNDVGLCNQKNTKKTDSVAPPQSEKRLTPNGYHNISIGDSISDIENKLGTKLDISGISEICDAIMIENDTIQLVFADDKLLFLDAFDNNTTDKGFKVGDTVASLKNKYPNVVYHFDEYPSVGDESTMSQSKYFTTKPNKKGNIYIFQVSDNDENIIKSIVIENIASRDKNVCEV